MATCLVTGGAGFLGSHLCDELLRRGHHVVCVDNLETGSLRNIEHIRVPEFEFLMKDIVQPYFVERAGRLRLPPRLAGLADRLPAPAAAHAEGRLARHAPHARPGQEAPRALPAGVDERGLRRPAGPSAEGDLLGPRQPDRPARRLRRGQALRRGADDGLPPPAGRRHGDHSHLQHLRHSNAPARRPRDPDVHAPGAAEPADHGVRRRQPDALVLLRRRPHPRHDRARGVRPAGSDQRRQPQRVHAAAARPGGHRRVPGRARRSSSRRCRPTTRRCASRTSRWRATCSAGSPRSSCTRASRARSRRRAPTPSSDAGAPDPDTGRNGPKRFSVQCWRGDGTSAIVRR